MKTFFIGTLALALLGMTNSFALITAPATYAVRCNRTANSDAGRMLITGTLQSLNGVFSGSLNVQLIIDSDSPDSPEAETHKFPTLKLSGIGIIRESDTTRLYKRPARLELKLSAVNPSVKDQFSEVWLIHNQPRSPNEDDEMSEIHYHGQTFKGACIINQQL